MTVPIDRKPQRRPYIGNASDELLYTGDDSVDECSKCGGFLAEHRYGLENYENREVGALTFWSWSVLHPDMQERGTDKATGLAYYGPDPRRVGRVYGGSRHHRYYATGVRKGITISSRQGRRGLDIIVRCPGCGSRHRLGAEESI